MSRIFHLLPFLLALGCNGSDATTPVEPLPSTWMVMPDSSGAFINIQAAIDGVPPGSIIELHDGTFTGPGNVDLDFKGKPLTIRSQSGNPTACVIECRRLMTPVTHRAFHFHSGERSDSRVIGVLIRHGYTDAGGGVLCEGASPVFEGCVFVTNTAMSAQPAGSGRHDSPEVLRAPGGAICCVRSSPLLLGCTFIDNHADDGGAVCARDHSFPTIRGSTFHRNHGFSNGTAIACLDTSTVRVETSIISFGGYGEPVTSWYGGRVDLSCTNIFGNRGGDWVGSIRSQRELNGNSSLDPLYCDESDNELYLRPESPCAPHDSCGLVGAWECTCPG